MSLNNIITTSLSGLFANQAALRATSNNVANVNTEHYSRVRVELEAKVTQGSTAGVSVKDVSRVVDQFLETALRTATSNASEFTAQREFHDRLQGILGDPSADSSLSSRIDQIFASVADLTLNPADVLRRQQTLSELQSFLDQTSLFHTQIQTLRGETSQQIDESVDAINEQLQRIHELNPLLAQANTGTGETGGLEGQLSQALASLSKLIDMKIDRQANGTVHVSTSSGYPLVDTSLSQLSYTAPGVVQADTRFPNITVARVNDVTLEPTSSSIDLTGNIRSGRLQGLLEMRDKQLPDLSLALGELGARIADEFNAVQNKYTAVPPPNSMTGKQTIVQGSDSTNFTGTVTFAIVDSNNQVVATHEVDFDRATPPADFDALITEVNGALGAGNGALALNNGVLSFTATTGNRVVIADDPTTPSDRGGRGFSHFFGMNDLITAAETGVYENGVASGDAHGLTASQAMSVRVVNAAGREVDTVTVTVPSGTTYGDMMAELNSASGLGAYFNFTLDGTTGGISWTADSGYEGASFQVISDNTTIGSTGLTFSQGFGLGDHYRINAANNLNVRQAIQDDPDQLALSVFNLSAGVGDVALTKGDQRGALALQELETNLVNFSDAGELKASNVTLSQYVSRFLGNAGLQAARATNFEEDNLALQQEIGQRNSDFSGVNLDEELANLVVYQNAYNAAARILSSVQELYDTLLGAV